MRVLLSCDRSKGHFYPALNLARCLGDSFKRESVFFQGIKYKDKKIVESEGFRYLGFDLKFRNIILEAALRFLEALIVILYVRPEKVFGFGGRNSFFIVCLSKLFFIPTFIFEPNVGLGQANKVLGVFADKIFTGLRNTQDKKEVNVGIPLRSELFKNFNKKETLIEFGLQPSGSTFLVFGGSLGSRFINKTFIETVKKLVHKYDFQVIHITGDRDFSELSAEYQRMGVNARVFRFYKDIGKLYSAADFVISRSGASTIAEICFFGKPSLLIPLPYASGHQKKNADFLLKDAAGLVEEQEFFNEHKLGRILAGFLNNPGEYYYLGVNAKKEKVWIDSVSFSKKILGLS